VRGILAAAMTLGMVSLVLFAVVARDNNVGQDLMVQLELALFAGFILLLVTEKEDIK
jgi:hypothetical protein